MRILVAYTTNSGSTEEVARAIGERLAAGEHGCQVDVRRLEELAGVESYDAVVIGAPMILGWHRSAVGFLKRHQAALGRVPVALFCTAMSLTETGDRRIGEVAVTVDPFLAKPPARAGRLSLKERYATLSNYLRPVLKAAPAVKPVSIGFFGGKLELFRLRFLQMLFVMLIIRAQPGDARNWAAIRAWADDLRAAVKPLGAA
jgi:menaquinone-dependent protoporphyrinogen oxidase